MADSEIKGLKELIRATQKIQADFPKVLDEAASRVAEKVVAGARGQAGTPQQRLAASTLSSMGQGNLGSKWPGFAGSEFGGGNRPSTRQFPPYRGKRGYFLYPSMRRNAPALNRIWDEAIEDVMSTWDYKPGVT